MNDSADRSWILEKNVVEEFIVHGPVADGNGSTR